MADLYSQKQPINRDGVCLAGTAPYDHDMCLGDHYDACFDLVKRVVSDCESMEVVVVCSTTVRQVFEERFGFLESVDIKKINGKDVRMKHMRHSEHTVAMRIYPSFRTSLN